VIEKEIGVIMNKNLPQDTKINIAMLNGIEQIIIPHAKAGIMKYFIGAFLLFWMFGWATGFVMVGSQILAGEGNAFLFFWFAGWSVGGFFAGTILFKIFRKSIPESLLLNRLSLLLDTGIPAFNLTLGNQKELWNNLFLKRQNIEFTDKELETLSLRETDLGNRLTVDKGSERIELAISATEIEREWLFEYLKAHYRIGS